MKKRIIIIAGAIIVIAAAVLAGRNMILNGRIKNKELISARWGVGGGMSGGHSSVEIKKDGDNTIVIREEQSWHNSDLIRTTYIVSSDAMDKLKQRIIEARVPVLSKRGMSSLMILDGDTYSFSCSFEGYLSYSVIEGQKKSSAEEDKLMRIRDLLYGLTELEYESTTEVIPGDASEE